MQQINIMVILYANSSLHAKVGGFLRIDGTWKLLSNSRELVDFFEQVQSILVEVGREDCVAWLKLEGRTV